MRSVVLCTILSGIELSAFAANGLANPERGFRFEQLVGLEDGERVTASKKSGWRFDEHAKDGVRIAQAYCYLNKYCEADVPQAKLDSLQADFDRARKLGVKFLLRFAYETDMTRRHGPTAERILAHIHQLTPIVRKNADVIYVLQTGWIGAWGEFHSSAHRLENNAKVVADVVAATLEMLPENRLTMMRTSRQRTMALGRLGGDREVTAETAWGSTPSARIGFFNDATLANCYDAGTFLEDYETYSKMSWADVLEAKLDQPGAPVNRRKAYFAILAADGTVKEIPTGFDCRRFAAERDTVVEADVPALKGGERLALWLLDESESIRDRPEYAIALAGGAMVERTGGRRLNVLSVDR